VCAGKKPTSVSGSVRGMLSGITSRGAKPQQAAAPQAAPTAAQPRAAAPVAQVSVTPPVTPVTPVTGDAHLAPSIAQAPAEPEHAKEAPNADATDAGEALPYWPALLPEFDQASHDFGWMRKTAVEFKKAQIEGKQKAVNTLAVYGRYKEYAQARAAAAAKNQQGAQQTGAATQQNVAHASQTEGQAGQGEAKQAQAKGAASDKAATDLPEPASTGFWGNILGAVKRWAKTDEMKNELRQLKSERQNQRKEFDSDPANSKRIDALEKLKHNYERSVEMARTLDGAGLPDTIAGNDEMIKQLLDVGQAVTDGNNVNVPTILVGKTGKVIAETTWTILPDGRAYLTTIKLKPVKP